MCLQILGGAIKKRIDKNDGREEEFNNLNFISKLHQGDKLDKETMNEKGIYMMKNKEQLSRAFKMKRRRII